MTKQYEMTYTNLGDFFYSEELPEAMKNPSFIIFNDELGNQLNIKQEIDLLSGNQVLEQVKPIAQAYAGHQFGYFNMLGDGRAILLTEVLDKDNQRFDVTLKRSGATKYSRGGDGKAGVGPMVREYLISEAMYHLNIPTTRSLSIVMSDDYIQRQTYQQRAVLTRIASSHIRVGTFQYALHYGDISKIKELADYTINRHYPHLNNVENKYLEFLKAVIEAQASLIAQWMLVGFIHGVMNTDNMSISGESIDYGPCAFMDYYHPDTCYSSIDTYKRYAYKNQPNIAKWNLARFAETLLYLIDDDVERAADIATKEIERFTSLYNKYYYDGFALKLGIKSRLESDNQLFEELLVLMERYFADYTNTFAYLSLNQLEDYPLFKKEEFKQWYVKYEEILKRENLSIEERLSLMQSVNPIIIPRNTEVEAAIKEAENHNFDKFYEMVKLLERPFDYNEDNTKHLNKITMTPYNYKTYCGT